MPSDTFAAGIEAAARVCEQVADGRRTLMTLRLNQLSAENEGFSYSEHGAMMMQAEDLAAAIRSLTPTDTDTAIPAGEVTPTDQQVREAMQTAWDDFCDDTGAIPGDIYREGGKTFFRAGTWADHAAMHLRAALAAKPIAGMDAGEVANEAQCERIDAMLELAEDFNEQSGDGALHIIVADGNVSDEHIDFCREQPNLTDDERAFLDRLEHWPEGIRGGAFELAYYTNQEDGK